MIKVASAILMIVAILSCDNHTKPSVKNPKLVFEKDTVNIGTVAVGDSTSFKIDVKNEGSDTLLIKNVAFGCGCTGGAIKDTHLAPNEKTILSVTYVNHGDANPINKTVILENNSLQPFKILRLLGTSVKPK